MDSDSSANDHKLNERLARFDRFCEYFEAALNRMPNDAVEEFLWLTVIHTLGQSNGYIGDPIVSDLVAYTEATRPAWSFDRLKNVLAERIHDGWDDKVACKFLILLADEHFFSPYITDSNVKQRWLKRRVILDNLL